MSDSHHIMPLKTYYQVFGALLLLTGVTVGVAYVDLVAANLPVALLIASCKGVLVILWFMHVKFSSRLTQLFVSAGFIWLVILVLIMTSDYTARGWM